METYNESLNRPHGRQGNTEHAQESSQVRLEVVIAIVARTSKLRDPS
jgi:hypothetical protein